MGQNYLFLSTPSVRRATRPLEFGKIDNKISIHALREEGDRIRRWDGITQNYFYPRPPRGGRRRGPRGRPGQFSIHALREEGDSSPNRATSQPIYFYPRPPRGGRLTSSSGSRPSAIFLSTPSARRATAISSASCPSCGYFYPRPPRGGRRPAPPAPSCPRSYFYPRPPRGGRQPGAASGLPGQDISIHALREEGDPPRP